MTLYTILRNFMLVWLLILSVSGRALAVEISKSPNDDRNYATLRMANGLRVMLISDPNTDKSAAALDVSVGSGSDPQRWPGLAHFLEHMLFLGTKKFPQTGEYQAFISRYGGSDNAYTSDANTNYFFDINPDYLRPVLERFSQFFIAPLFTEKFVEREKNAINSEFQSRRQSAGRRRMSAVRQVMNPAHPWSKFSVGNLETLADKPDETTRQALLQFYQRHYSANLMTLVVLGKEEIPVLKSWVEQLFGDIPDRKARRAKTLVPLFSPGTLPLRLRVQAVRDQRSLSVMFPIPALLPYYRSKPMRIVGEQLGHEGAGSLLAALKSKGWARSLSAGGGSGKKNESTFDVNIELTKAGFAHQDDILALLFQTIRLIRKQGVKAWVYAEQAQLAALQFRFKSQSSAQATVRSVAQTMQDIPVQDVLAWPWMMQGFDAAVIKRLMAPLRPENALITVMAPEYKGLRQQTRWYATGYQRQNLDPASLAYWRQNTVKGVVLTLPYPNAFIPKNLDLVSGKNATAAPIRVKSPSGMPIWHQTDLEFKSPRASFYFSIRSPAANDSPRDTMLTELYARLVKDQLNEYAYNAGLAGLRYDLYRHVRGLSVRIDGYSDKQALLLTAISGTLRQPTLSTQRFAVLKNALLEELRNKLQRKPYVRALNAVRTLLIKPWWTDEQLLEALLPLTVADLEQFLPRFWSSVQVVVLSHGNVSVSQTQARAQILQKQLRLDGQEVAVPKATVVALDRGQHYRYQLAKAHPDAATVLYYQGWNKSWKQRAQFALLAQIMSSPFYQRLRTEQQLGYVVFATGMPILNYPGLALTIESPNTAAPVLALRMQRFLQNFKKTLTTMSAQRFAAHKQALITQLNEKEKNLSSRSARYWQEIDDELDRFDSRQQLTRQLRQLEQPDLIALFEQAVLDPTTSANLLILHAGKNREGSKPKPVADAVKWSEIENMSRFKVQQRVFSQ